VRAATSLRLENGVTRTYTAFDIQLRRRLLFAIGILDTHCALDRGTVPIMRSTAFRARPLHINDNDMSPPDKVPTESSPNFTDMSHTSMIYEAMICQRKLYELSNVSGSAWENWPAKMELIAAFERHVQNNDLFIKDSEDPLHKLQRISGQKILVSLQLLARRPPYRQPHNAVPPWDDFDVLEAATNVLDQHLQPMAPELAAWAWKNWVQWHALAVVLVELLARPPEPLLDRAYQIAIKSFRHYARIVADSESGMLWKPIAKLMRRVQRVRQDACSNPHPAPSNGHSVPDEVVEEQSKATDCTVVQDMEIDFTNWNFDSDGSSTFFTEDLLPQAQDENQYYDSGTPWLAWDTFLHDVYLPDA